MDMSIRRTSQRSIRRVRLENSIFDRYGTPKDERSNPLKEWRSRGPPHGMRHSDPLNDLNADLDDGRQIRSDDFCH